MNVFQTILEKSNSDQEFAQKLFFTPLEACASAGIVLNDNQQKILQGSIEQAQRYFAERLFLLTKEEDVLSNGWCWGCSSGGTNAK